MKERTSQTRCGTIHYWVSVSNPDTITLVFLPGLTVDHRSFDKQIQYFENRYNVIVWDAPAHILFCLEAWYTLHIDAPEGGMEMETEKVYVQYALQSASGAGYFKISAYGLCAGPGEQAEVGSGYAVQGRKAGSVAGYAD